VKQAVSAIYEKDDVTDEEVALAIDKWPGIVSALITGERGNAVGEPTKPLNPQALQTVNINRKNNDETPLEVNATVNQLTKEEVSMLADEGSVEPPEETPVVDEDEPLTFREMATVNELLRGTDGALLLRGDEKYGDLMSGMKQIVDDYRASGSPITQSESALNRFVAETTGVNDDSMIGKIIGQVDNETLVKLQDGRLTMGEMEDAWLDELKQDISKVSTSVAETPAQFNEDVAKVMDARDMDVDELRQQLLSMGKPIETFTVDELEKLLGGDKT